VRTGAGAVLGAAGGNKAAFQASRKSSRATEAVGWHTGAALVHFGLRCCVCGVVLSCTQLLSKGPL
jgi:hypothetical protein